MPALPRVGLHYVATPESMAVSAFASAAAERGFAGIFLPEHTHIPVSRATPYPGGGDMPEKYARVWDPYVALSFIAAQTELTIGTCVSLVGHHDAIALAKTIATLDQLSDGRMILGVGYGWNREEFEDHGHMRADVRAVVREKVALMKQIWTEDVASYTGEHVQLEPSWSWPKPAQRPHPPVLLGVPATELHFEELAQWADGWIPMAMPTAAELTPDVHRLHRSWDGAGRDRATLQIAAMQVPDGERLTRELQAFAALGVGWLLVDVPTAPSDVVLPVLDDLSRVAALAHD
jgi:probable F420-dependent oxidoreductase